MAAARARRDPARTPAPRSARPTVKAVAGRPTVNAQAGSGIRWDRLSRMVLLVVLLGIVSLYVGPLMSFWSTRQEAATKRTEVQRLRDENAVLRARRTALRSKGTLEKEARRLGMVRPGERPYSVSGLPKGP